MPMTGPLQPPVEVFISYAPPDEGFRIDLVKSLAALRKAEIIRVTHSGKIEAGQESAAALSHNIGRARIILLLISPDYIDSRQCYDFELALACKRFEREEAQLIPVIIRPCDWEGTHLGEFAVLPESRRPVSLWNSQDVAFTAIAKEIRSRVETMVAVRVPKSLMMSKSEYLNLLSYFSNRTEQDRVLLKVLSAPSPHRPSVCIIHGYGNESHDMYEKRLKHKTLPTLLGRGKPDALSVKDFFLPFPNGIQNVAHGLNELRSTLAERLADNREADEEKIARAISRHHTPVIIHTYIASENWEPHGPDIVDGLIRYWCAFPDLPPTTNLLVCLFVIYRVSGAAPTQKAQGEVSRRAREFLNSLDFSTYGGVRGAVLPEMLAISLKDAEDYIRETNFTEFCEDHSPHFFNVPMAIKEIRDFYGPRHRVPMDDLSQKLLRVFENNFC